MTIGPCHPGLADQFYEGASVAAASPALKSLSHDEEVRNLHMTAVTSRVCAVDWTTAGRLASQPAAYAHRAHFLATRFAREALNPRDPGARWCSSVMLRELSPMIGRSPA